MNKHKKTIIRIFAILGVVAMLGTALLPAIALGACDPNNYSITGGINCGAPNSASQSNLFGEGGLFQRIANTIIFIVGAVAVIMVIVGGLRYVLSSGNPQATAGAKDTILYAIIGVIVAALAYAIVAFVVGRIGGGG